MQVKYFDGQTSRPYPVKIEASKDSLHITSVDFSKDINLHWHKALIRSESTSTGNKILLSYGDEFPPEQLEITGTGADTFIRDILQYESNLKSVQFQITRMKAVPLVALSILVIGLSLSMYFGFMAPYIGEKAVILVPKTVEEEYGNKVHQLFFAGGNIDQDKSKLMMDFYQAIGFESDYPIQIDYVNDPIVNALAVPGGHIVVYDGLVDKMTSWEELAAVIGHELVHVNQRHGFKGLARSLSSRLAISVIAGDVGSVSSIFLKEVNRYGDKAYSRSHEKEADLEGLDYMFDNQINPQGMLELLEILISERSPDQETPSRLGQYKSSHPLTEKRIDYIKAEIEKVSDQQDYRDNAEAVRIFELLKQ